MNPPPPASAPAAADTSSRFDSASGSKGYEAEAEAEVEGVLDGFKECAKIAAGLGVQPMLEALCFNLHRHTNLSLAHLDLAAEGGATGAHRSVSQVGVAAFGRSRKSQVALHALVHLCTKHGPLLRRGWWCVFECLVSLAAVKVITVTLPSYAASQDTFASSSRSAVPGNISLCL